MNKIKIIMTCVVGMIATQMLAQQSREWLNVWQKDGTSVSFKLHEQPKVSFLGHKVKMTTASQFVEWNTADVARFELSEQMASAIQPTLADRGVRPQHTPDGIRIEHAQPGSIVTLYSLDGKVLSRQTADDQGSLTISVQNSEASAVILQVGTTTYKMTTR